MIVIDSAMEETKETKEKEDLCGGRESHMMSRDITCTVR
jgi:hypothetical protein